MAAASEVALLRQLPSGKIHRRLLRPPVAPGDHKMSGVIYWWPSAAPVALLALDFWTIYKAI